VQPALTSDGDVLMSAVSAAGGTGMRRVAVVRGTGRWTVEERWTSAGLKPYFNTSSFTRAMLRFRRQHLACIDLKDGRRQWKGGRYGHGQLLLLSDQDLLLVLSEEGELALVAAAPANSLSSRGSPRSKARPGTPGSGRRRPAGSQQPGDGRVPAVPRAPVMFWRTWPKPVCERLSQSQPRGFFRPYRRP